MGTSQSEYNTALTVTKRNDSTTYNQRFISSAYIVDLSCQTEENCQQTNFNFNAYGKDMILLLAYFCLAIEKHQSGFSGKTELPAVM